MIHEALAVKLALFFVIDACAYHDLISGSLALFRTAVPHCAIPCCFSVRTQLITNHIASSFAFRLDISKNIPLNHCRMSICKKIFSRNSDITLTIVLIMWIYSFIQKHFVKGVLGRSFL